MYHVRALKLAGLARLALARLHARMRIRACVNLKFRGSYFRGSGPIREKREILHHAKISRYTVYVIHYKYPNISKQFCSAQCSGMLVWRYLYSYVIVGCTAHY